MGYLSGYKYRKSITVSRASGAVSNYQMQLLLGESSGATGEDVDCGGLCLSNFNDIRFTKSDGVTLLDYWIESITDTTPNQLATIWIEFDSIGTGATTFYMYYGNPSASAASDGDTTFLLFDDFNDGTIDAAKWTNPGGFSEGDGVLSKYASNTSTQYFFKSVDVFTAPLAIHTKTKVNSDWSNEHSWSNAVLFDEAWATSGFLSGHYKDAGTDYYSLMKFPVSVADSTNESIIADTYYQYELKILDGDQKFLVNGVQKGVLSITPLPTNPTNILLATARGATTSAYTTVFDYIFVRYCLAVEPAWGSWGSQEVIITDLTLGDFNKTYSFELTKDLLEIMRTLNLNDFNQNYSLDLTKGLIEVIRTLYLSGDGYTKLLIHGDGIEGSQVFEDATGQHNISVVGTLPQISSISKFGSGSISFPLPSNIPGNYLSIPDSEDWNLFSDDFTIDFWVYLKSNPFDEYQYILSRDDLDGKNLSVYIYHSVFYDEFQVALTVYDTGWQKSIFLETDEISGISAEEFHHIEISVHDNVPKIFVDGVSRSLEDSDYLLIPAPEFTSPLIIGADGAEGAYGSDILIDELRISKGIARHTEDFTVPMSPYSIASSFEITSSLELEKSFQGIITRYLNNFDIQSSLNLSKQLERIITLGDFNMTFSWYYRFVFSIASYLILKSHLLAGGSLRLKNNLNVQNIIQSNLFLKNTINSYTTISNDLTLLNSLIGSVEGSLVLPNRLTEPVTGNLGLRNKLTDKNDVEGSMTLRNRIDPQQEEYSGFVFSEEFSG